LLLVTAEGYETVELLIGKGAVLDTVGGSGRTALVRVVVDGSGPVALAPAANAAGATVLRRVGYRSVVRTLLEATMKESSRERRYRRTDGRTSSDSHVGFRISSSRTVWATCFDFREERRQPLRCPSAMETSFILPEVFTR
jgi:hypothetical protein